MPLDIDQMTIAEKLRVMEQLWDDLRKRAEGVPMPQWHKNLLDERGAAIAKGQAQLEGCKEAHTKEMSRTLTMV